MDFNDRFKYQGIAYSAGFVKVAKKDWVPVDNSHIPDCLELIYCISGNDEICVDGKIYSIVPGTVRISPPSTQIKENAKVRTLEESEFIDVGFITKNPFVTKTVVIDAADNLKIRELFIKLTKLISQKREVEFFEFTSVFYLLVQELETLMDSKVEVFKAVDEKLQPAMNFIYNHYSEQDFVLSNLPKMCGMKKNQFYRTFQKRHNITPSSYVTNLRMQLAVDLLHEGELSISAIAEKCGYESLAYFSRVFTKKFGKSPSKYLK